MRIHIDTLASIGTELCVQCANALFGSAIVFCALQPAIGTAKHSAIDTYERFGNFSALGIYAALGLFHILESDLDLIF